MAAKAEKTFVAANNHPKGQAAANAIELKSLLSDKKVKAPEPLVKTYPELKEFAATENLSQELAHKKAGGKTGRTDSDKNTNQDAIQRESTTLSERNAPMLQSGNYASLLRQELCERNAAYARQHQLSHVTSIGIPPVVVYQPSECGRYHGNFIPRTYRAICRNPDWCLWFAQLLGKINILASGHVLQAGKQPQPTLLYLPSRYQKQILPICPTPDQNPALQFMRRF